jgi:hypothetical protein
MKANKKKRFAALAAWLEMIQGAGHTLDLAEFYLSGQNGEELAGHVAR